jgi:S-phase kinase-associated protein 1
MSTQIEIITNDQQKFLLDRDAILMSGLVTDMLADEDEDSEDIPSIPVPNVDSKCMEKVEEYVKHHWNNRAKKIEQPLRATFNELISEWDQKFLEKIDQELLMKLLMAANYLHIPDLLDLTCAKAASMIKGKSPQQVCDMLGIENTYTEEEIEKINEENRWVEEA